MFEGFSSFDIPIETGVTIHGVQAGNGPPLLLLHGFPQTYLIWHEIVPSLTDKYTVIAIDLRGYGASSKPRSSPEVQHEPYSKRTMAKDCVCVMDELGFHDSFYVCGHDRGARVAHALCVHHPTRVSKAMFLDIVPTLTMFEQVDAEFAKIYYHWFFLIQPSPMPERMIMSNADTFLDVSQSPRNPSTPFAPLCKEAYKKQLTDFDSAHGMCEDYRAAASIDLEHARDDERHGRRIQCRLRCLWGAKGFVEKKFQGIGDWQKVHSNPELVDGSAVESGHFIPEENPAIVLQNILDFF